MADTYDVIVIGAGPVSPRRGCGRTAGRLTAVRFLPGWPPSAAVVSRSMATAWQGLGSKVTLLARRSGLLPRMEPFVGELVGRGLAEAGVNVRVGFSITELRRPGGADPATVSLDDGTPSSRSTRCTSPPAGLR